MSSNRCFFCICFYLFRIDCGRRCGFGRFRDASRSDRLTEVDAGRWETRGYLRAKLSKPSAERRPSAFYIGHPCRCPSRSARLAAWRDTNAQTVRPPPSRWSTRCKEVQRCRDAPSGRPAAVERPPGSPSETWSGSPDNGTVSFTKTCGSTACREGRSAGSAVRAPPPSPSLFPACQHFLGLLTTRASPRPASGRSSSWESVEAAVWDRLGQTWS